MTTAFSNTPLPNDFNTLVRFLEEDLDWPLGEYDFEQLTFEYTPNELGLKDEDAAKIRDGRIYQLRQPPGGMPWGIFFVEFEKKIPIVVLRRILGSLAIRKRASATKPSALPSSRAISSSSPPSAHPIIPRSPSRTSNTTQAARVTCPPCAFSAGMTRTRSQSSIT
jgi:hypothetical protein